MRNRLKIYTFGTLLALVGVSCDKYLDELPDNRTTLDTPEKIRRVLVKAYPENSYNLVTELSSDNIDDQGETNPNTSPFYEAVAYWEHTTETSSGDDLAAVWRSHYRAIAHSNEALKAIEELGNPSELNSLKAEALITRAYNHFVLVNLFGNHYNAQTSSTDFGITYMEEPETELAPKYSRGTVLENYQKINEDIEQALPMIDDDIYQVPKYHFNQAAAYAFAARFNLYYEKWDKAVEYATKALGNNLSTVLRDWSALAALPKDFDVVTKNYISADHSANLLMNTLYSGLPVFFGPYYTGGRFNHSRSLADRETLYAAGPWGSTNNYTYKFSPFGYSATNLDKTLYAKLPYLFQFTDIVAQIGYQRAVIVPFTTDETLLTRAEAYIMQKNYTEAVNDLNTWSKNFYANRQDLTLTEIETFFQGVQYSTADSPTLKKQLNPKFAIEQGTQENLLHCVLQYRRILTLHEGQRWFDIRRYGIEVSRLQYQQNGTVVSKDVLTTNDLRRTFQIPQDVINAGYTPNPR